ncbi:MAG: DUF4433 domain-containing protein [Muribaculaceae bacterium]
MSKIVMCYEHGYNVNRVSPENIVYLVVKLDSIVKDDNYKYYFSDGHAVCKMTRFYGRESISDIDNILDKKSIQNNDWGNDYTTRERK